MKVSVSISMCVLFLSSCVSTHSGPVVSRADYAVSCDTDPRMSTDYTVHLVCAFENISENWQTFQIESISLSDSSRPLTAVERDAYLDAIALELQKNDHNFGLAMSGLVVSGALLASASGSRSDAMAGAAAMGVGAGTAAGKSTYDIYHAHQYGTPEYGKENLMSKATFQVPQELFLRKSTLAQLAQKKHLPNSVRICLSQPAKECLDLPIFSAGRSKRSSRS